MTTLLCSVDVRWWLRRSWPSRLICLLQTPLNVHYCNIVHIPYVLYCQEGNYEVLSSSEFLRLKSSSPDISILETLFSKIWSWCWSSESLGLGMSIELSSPGLHVFKFGVLETQVFVSGYLVTLFSKTWSWCWSSESLGLGMSLELSSPGLHVFILKMFFHCSTGLWTYLHSVFNFD